MTDYNVVTEKLREEAKLWQEKADKAQPILQAVQGTYLSPPAFFVGDPTIAPAIANAAFEAKQYEEFRSFMERMIQSAITEFNQIDTTLRKIADDYDRTDSTNEIDIDQAYHT